MLNQRISFGQKIGLSRADAAELARLKTPEKIQDYLDDMRRNLELNGNTCLSVSEVLRHRHAHCIEGAFLAACALWVNGQPPLLMDFQAKGDHDHVVTVFQHKGYWGAISKSNHVWLRWRDPIYRSLRELAMSYFHEYVAGSRKTLRTYSAPFDLSRYNPKLWVTNPDTCWEIAEALDGSRHYPLITPAQVRSLRPRDKMEVKAGKMLEYTA